MNEQMSMAHAEFARFVTLKSIIFWDMTPCSRLLHNGLHGVASQKMILFMTTAVKTSNPAFVTSFSDTLILCNFYNADRTIRSPYIFTVRSAQMSIKALSFEAGKSLKLYAWVQQASVRQLFIRASIQTIYI
jgi:hypothetical protein